MGTVRGVIFDVDGTLVDSNDMHARAWEEAFREAGYPVRERYLPLIKPFPRTRELLLALREAGLKVAVASSAGLIEHKASSDDAESSKPDPDIVQAARRRLDLPRSDVVMVGDTPYDVEAATRAGIPIIAFRSGGWNDEALAGAREIYDGPADLLARLPESMLLQGRAAAV